MAPKEPFKVHSLSKHIENTNKGLSAESQYNRRPANRATVVKRESDSRNPNNIFKNGGDNDDDEESSSESDSSSDEEGTSNFLQKLGATGVKTATPARRRDKNIEIADSDAERNASSKTASVTKSGAKSKPESESDDSSSESESTSESEANPEAKAKTNGTTKASDSTSNTPDSESESESNDDTAAKPAQLAKATPKEDSSESSSEESSEDESEDEPEVKAKPAVNGKAAAAVESDSGDESESENEDEPAKPAPKVAEPESSSDEDSDDEMVDESMHIEDRQVQRNTSVPNFIAPDFVLRKGDDGTNGKDVAEICNQANLEGKQFWYFTVPASVPISVVQNMEIPMDNSQQGSAVFSHDGEDYGVSFESIAPKSNIQILIPSANSSQYKSSSRPINQVMQVKKITQLASLPSSTVEPAAKRPARPQPEGLKSRYQPLGTAQSTTEEDVEMAEAPIAAVESKASKKEKKSSSKNTEVSTPVSRKGKRKHTPSEEYAIAAAEQLQEESKSASKKSKKQKTDRSGSPDLGSETPSTKKQTRVPPPNVPQAATPTPKAAPPAVTSTVKKSKKSKESKVELPIMTSKQTPVPVPSIPFSSQSNATVASPSVTKEERRSKKRKEKEAGTSKKMTPVLPPQLGSSS